MTIFGAVRAAGLFTLGTLFLGTSGSAASPLGLYDGNGVLLGTYIASEPQDIEFATSRGYIADVQVNDDERSQPNGTIGGRLDSAFTWNSTDCSGPALTADPVAGRLAWIDTPKRALGYVSIDAVGVTLAAGTTVSGYPSGSSQCVTRTLSRGGTFLPVLPNDPAVTGVSGSVVTLPLKIAFIDRVFFDGFEHLS
jgi:hypothetical protein